jgi:hypothetical protein
LDEKEKKKHNHEKDEGQKEKRENKTSQANIKKRESKARQAERKKNNNKKTFWGTAKLLLYVSTQHGERAREREKEPFE